MPGFHVAQTPKGLEIDVHVITRNLAIFYFAFNSRTREEYL